MTDTNQTTPSQPAFELNFSRQFESWFKSFNASITFSTYQAGKVFMLGMGTNGISIAEHSFARCMGLAARADRMYLASQYQLWRFNNVLDAGQDYQGYDKLFIPHLGHTTGDVDAHDIGIDGNGEPVFVNTLFSCLARPSPRRRPGDGRAQQRGDLRRAVDAALATLVQAPTVATELRQWRAGTCQSQNRQVRAAMLRARLRPRPGRYDAGHSATERYRAESRLG